MKKISYLFVALCMIASPIAYAADQGPDDDQIRKLGDAIQGARVVKYYVPLERELLLNFMAAKQGTRAAGLWKDAKENLADLGQKTLKLAQKGEKEVVRASLHYYNSQILRKYSSKKRM